MKNDSNFNSIAKRISSIYEPATVDNYEEVLEFGDFLQIFSNDDYLPFEIEEALEELGFKNEESRIEFSFLVKSVEEEEDV